MSIWGGDKGIYWPGFLLAVNHQIAWRFISSAVMITPFVLIIIAVRGKFSPGLRSCMLGACFWGLFLPFQRSAFYFFEWLYPLVTNASKTLRISGTEGIILDVFTIISLLWLAGFLFFFVRRGMDYSKTVKLFREGEMKSCASYFYKFRSRIYTPPDFETAYSTEEQEMLLAHERQHIKQHDPFVYRVLAFIECACWFNPLISRAVRHYQHERELLCDERVTRAFPKRDYGMLILKAAEKKPAMRAATAGIVMEHGSISERVRAMVEPIKTVGKWTAAALVCLLLVQLAAGFMGFQPAWRKVPELSPEVAEALGFREVSVYRIEDVTDFSPETVKYEHIDGMEDYVTVSENDLSFDEEGMYDYAMSIGLTEKNGLMVVYTDGVRPTWGAGETMYSMYAFAIVNMRDEELYFEIRPSDDIYSILTNLFI